jgi:hypothetical protein
MQQTTGTFRASSWEEAAFSSVEGGARLTRARVVNVFRGGVEGAGVLEYLMVYLDRERGTFFGFEHVTGRLEGREGMFVLRHAELRGAHRGRDPGGGEWLRDQAAGRADRPRLVHRPPRCRGHPFSLRYDLG